MPRHHSTNPAQQGVIFIDNDEFSRLHEILVLYAAWSVTVQNRSDGAKLSISLSNPPSDPLAYQTISNDVPQVPSVDDLTAQCDNSQWADRCTLSREIPSLDYWDMMGMSPPHIPLVSLETLPTRDDDFAQTTSPLSTPVPNHQIGVDSTVQRDSCEEDGLDLMIEGSEELEDWLNGRTQVDPSLGSVNDGTSSSADRNPDAAASETATALPTRGIEASLQPLMTATGQQLEAGLADTAQTMAVAASARRRPHALRANEWKRVHRSGRIRKAGQTKNMRAAARGTTSRQGGTTAHDDDHGTVVTKMTSPAYEDAGPEQHVTNEASTGAKFDFEESGPRDRNCNAEFDQDQDQDQEDGSPHPQKIELPPLTPATLRNACHKTVSVLNGGVSLENFQRTLRDLRSRAGQREVCEDGPSVISADSYAEQFGDAWYEFNPDHRAMLSRLQDSWTAVEKDTTKAAHAAYEYLTHLADMADRYDAIRGIGQVRFVPQGGRGTRGRRPLGEIWTDSLAKGLDGAARSLQGVESAKAQIRRRIKAARRWKCIRDEFGSGMFMLLPLSHIPRSWLERGSKDDEFKTWLGVLRKESPAAVRLARSIDQRLGSLFNAADSLPQERFKIEDMSLAELYDCSDDDWASLLDHITAEAHGYTV